MKCINIQILKGTVGQDARIGRVGERQVANFSVATDYEYKSSDGTWQKETTWHFVCAWQGFGVCDLNLIKKGTVIHAVGRVRTRKYIDQSTNQEKVITELLAETLDIVAPEEPRKPAKGNAKPLYNNIPDRDEDDF